MPLSETDNIKQLVAKRGQLKAQITRFMTYLNCFEEKKDYN